MLTKLVSIGSLALVVLTLVLAGCQTASPNALNGKAVDSAGHLDDKGHFRSN